LVWVVVHIAKKKFVVISKEHEEESPPPLSSLDLRGFTPSLRKCDLLWWIKPKKGGPMRNKEIKWSLSLNSNKNIT
jgi:hypothetical protein